MTLELITIAISLIAIAVILNAKRGSKPRNLTKRDLWCLGWDPTHQHIRTEGFYEEATRAIAAGDITDGEAAVVYVNKDGRVFVRAVREFDQPERFKELPSI